MGPSEQPVRTVVVTTLRTDLGRVRQFVAYHQNLGVQQLILFFDNPGDPAIEEVRAQPGVSAIACDEDHWHRLRGGRPEFVQARQVANVNYVLESRGDDFDWLMHIDSDELIHAPFGLAQTLQAEGAGLSLLQMPVLEAIPASPDDDPFRSTTLFRRHRPKREQLARRRGAASGFQGSSFLRGHVQGKPAVHLDGVVGRISIHRATLYDEQRFTRGVAKSIRVLHYDAGSFDDWCTKWRNRHRFSQEGHKASRMAQWDQFARLDALGDEQGLRELYRSNFMLPDREVPTLVELGLVQRVHLEASWFDGPPDDRLLRGTA